MTTRGYVLHSYFGTTGAGHLRLATFTCLALLLTAITPSALNAQPDDSPANAQRLENGRKSAPAAVTPQPPRETVRLNFPPNTPVTVLIDFVAQRLSLNILYDEQVARAKVTLKSPTEVPVDTLPGLLDAALRMNGFALVQAQEEGWYQVIAVRDLPNASKRLGGEAEDQAAVLTQVFKLENSDPARLEAAIRPFLTPQGAGVIVDAERRLLIVTDFRDRVQRIERLIERLDQPTQAPDIAFVQAKHTPATELAQRVMLLVTAQLRVAGGHTSGAGSGRGGSTLIEITADERTNRVVLIGPPELLNSATQMAEKLDVDLGLVTRVYVMSHVSPKRLDTLVRQLIDPLAVDRLYRTTTESEGGVLVVSATEALHDKVADLKKQVDKPIAEAVNPVRFYKLQNADAAEVLATIRAIEGGAGMDSIGLAPGSSSPGGSSPGISGGGMGDQGIFGDGSQADGDERASDLAGAFNAVKTRDATVTADKNLNSIIVVAEPRVQQVYASLIKQLDQRRPQVMIEATIVTLDTSNGFTLGVEILAGDTDGDNLAFAFSSFGFSSLNDQGGLDLIPGVGLNGAVLQADIADIILRALKTDGRAKVVSAPKILVNDNATGTIASVAEQPVTSINQGQNTDTVTFSQYVDAGTDITVTPHIAEGDHLRLEFEVALESFTGDSSAGVPPPRQSNTVSSEVTIPDGTTIVVGGVNRRDISESISRVPLLGEIPILEFLFSSRTYSDTESTLFVFLRPVILRDDRFQDLKYYSGRDLANAELPPEYPSSEPMLVR